GGRDMQRVDCRNDKDEGRSELGIDLPAGQEKCDGEKGENSPAQPSEEGDAEAQAREPVAGFIPPQEPGEREENDAAAGQQPGSPRRDIRRCGSLLGGGLVQG